MSKGKSSRRRDRQEKTGRIIRVHGGVTFGKSGTVLRLAGAKSFKVLAATGQEDHIEMAIWIRAIEQQADPIGR